MWLKCTWPDDSSSDNVYFFFAAGPWDDDYNSLLLYFEETSEGNWRIRISDGNDEGSNPDIMYNIDYDGDYMNQWKHVTLTYDDYTMRLYIDGVKKKEGSFTFNKIPYWHCVVGGHDSNHTEDFRGYISGFRVWKDKKLTDSDVAFIWDKTFDDAETMGSHSNLYQYLTINMFTSSTNIYSLIPDKSMAEYGTTISTVEYNPARPINAYNASISTDYTNISLDWESNSSYHTHYIYRRLDGADWELLCRTNDTYYIDDDPLLVGGEPYDYKIRTYWYNPSTNQYLDAEADINFYNYYLKEYENVTGLIVTEDADSVCNGTVKLEWNQVTEPSIPSTYTLYANIDNEGWQVLDNSISAMQYTHTVDAADLGKPIQYRVDANGDDYLNYSSIKTGTANTECTTAPTNVVATLNGDVFDISWDFTQVGAPATAFRIYRKIGAGSFEIIEEDIDINDRLYTDIAESCIDHEYKVEAYNQCGEDGSLSTTSGTVYKTMVFDNVFAYQDDEYVNHADFDASKGYYSTKVLLEWSINPNKMADVDEFEIYRRKSGQSYSLLTTVTSANATYYEDNNTEANVFYEYLIRAKGECNAVVEYSDTLEATGFRYSSGIVSGKVTYSGGNAVEGVEVRVSTDENLVSGSLYFDGIQKFSYTDDISDDSLFHNPFSFEGWIKPELMMSGQRNVFYTIYMGNFYIGLQNMRPIAAINEHFFNCSGGDTEDPIAQLEGDTILSADTWYHIAVTIDPYVGEFIMYLNGEEIASTIYSNLQIPWVPEDVVGNDCGPRFDNMMAAMGIGRLVNTLYKGNMDEVRIWQRVRTPEEIERDYTRILTGSEEGLIGYYRLDESFGYGAYDLSNVNYEFNKNDFVAETGYEEYWPDWSTETPSFEQLHPSGITNENGNYIIKGIRYSGNGNVFSISPFLGVHEFNPTDITLFIGDGTPVHNGIDFVDQSAFDFAGTVYYNNTNFPVEAANVYIDNTQQFDPGGDPIQTDQYGNFTVSVPIGEHFITIKKNGHTFIDNGQWPSPTDNDPYATHNFQDNVYGITFYDTTTVIVAGRFVGGDVEGDKVVGFDESINNIGVGTIIFENEQGYDIDYSDAMIDTTMVSVTTDSESGEYEIRLLPEVYKIHSCENDHYTIDNLDLGLLDLCTIHQLTTETDTIYTEVVSEEDTITETDILEYDYHFLRNFIYYETPEIVVYGEDENPLFGEEQLIILNPETEENDTLDLVNSSPLNYPVFEMGKVYDITVKVQSEYVNYDNDDTVYNIVPIYDASVNITNNLEIHAPSYEFGTNEDGIVADYPYFRVGVPNMTEDADLSFTKTMTITADADYFSVQWAGNEGNLYRAYVLGGVDYGGVNFVTYGPEIPTYILRDPPGTNSYTYLEKESGYTISQSYDFNFGGGSTYDNKLLYGSKFEVGGGLAGPVFEAEHKNTLNGGIESSNFVNEKGEFTESVTFTQRFSTSSEPNAVGSNADVYIGKSYNMFFTQTLNLRVLPTTYCQDNGLEHLDPMYTAETCYTLGKREGFAVTEDSSATYFIYSQDHILNSLLPNYRDLIYALLETSPLYESKIPADHILYGTSNEAPIWADTIAMSGDTLPSYVFLGDSTQMDSIAFLNQQISVWMQTIALNEKAKVEAEELVENISIDGTAGVYESIVSYTSTDKEETTYNYKFKLFGGAEMGFELNKFGFQIVSNTYKEWERELGFEYTEQRRMTFGYVIDDPDMSDYYSIDVKMDEDGVMKSNVDEYINTDNQDDFADFNQEMQIMSGVTSGIAFAYGKLLSPAIGQIYNIAFAVALSSCYLGEMANYRDDIDGEDVSYGLTASSPIFSILGGRSSCPYEGPEYTTLYLDSATNEPYILHQGTQQREDPVINIEPASVINVPDGEAAVFELKLTNNSFTGHDFIYELQVDEDANPHGAVIKIDGLNPNRSFFVAAGETLTKTLTVEQNPAGDMEYDDLQLIFHSSCQYDPTDNFPDIADSVTFSAHFIPACTEVTFSNITDDWVINVYNENVMPVTVSGYNINQSTFDKVYFQYYQSGTTPTTFMTLYNDTVDTDWAGFTGEKLYIDGESSVSFDWDVSSLNDGNYTLVLTSMCSDGSINESDHLVGTIDRITPRPFGTPEPADGILSYGDDISILFNEDINSGELFNFGQYGSESYIKLRGMLNGTDIIDSPTLLHDASVHFDGVNDNLKIDHINLDHSDFTIEFWAKRNGTGRECLINIGNPIQGGLWIGFNESDHVVIEMDGQTMISESAYPNLDEWVFYTIVYDRGDETLEPQMTMFILSGASGSPEVLEFDMYSSLEGTMYVAYCPEDASAFYGNIHELRIWNYTRQITEISSQKGQILNGYEEGLYGLWPLNEASGDYAKDIAFGRDAEMNGTWHVSRDGKGLDLQGDNCFPVPAGSMVFSDQTDFTIEFWFKLATPVSDVALISNGYFENDFNQHGWNITATSDNEISVSNNGNSVSITADEYLDNSWHHFALSLNRIGYLSIYLDGNLVETESPTNFEGFGASQFVAGARWYNLAMIDYYDQYMTGQMDEIRFWNSARTQDQIQRYMNYTLSGDEPGLKGYFPFEDVTIPNPSISNENSGNFTLDTIGIAGDTLLPVNVFTSETQNMKLQRPEVLIPHTIVISDDEVVITPNVDDNEIENQILDISIRGVKDLNNNVLASTITWPAFVDRNNVVWDLQEIEIEKFVEEETIVAVNVRNKGGLNESYNITNIPDWMEVNPSSGNLSPLEVEEIEITIKPELNIGEYDHDINLVASMDYNERLGINVKVNGHAPEWSVNPEDYLYTANIIGQLSIGGILSTDEEDIVACFVDDECRGVANVKYFDNLDIYLVFLNAYANEDGENIEFRVYDASTGEIFANVTPSLEFEANELYGSIADPLPINATNFVQQTFAVN